MKNIIIFLILLGLSSCNKNSNSGIYVPIPTTTYDTVAREFKIVSLNKTRTWTLYVNHILVNSNIIDTIDANYVSTKFFIHKNDLVNFKDSTIMDNNLYIYNPSVLITQKQCSNCFMVYKFKMN